MDSSEAGPTEDTVLAFLDYLVDPVLRGKSQTSRSPTQLQLVAKQVQAVVLLYNYYHRKKHPCLGFLGFEPFCKLAGVLKTNLIEHMKFMHESNDTVVEDVGKQFSVTEKAIMDACDISQCLYASQGIPNVEGWPVSNVSVFLIDSKKENCFLLYSSMTQGVWSLIEKEIDVSNGSAEAFAELKYMNKRKRIIKKPERDESNISESSLQKLAYSAVKGVSDICQNDLLILERHSIYSLSKEKTSTRFFIMQSAESSNDEIIQVPIKDVLDSLLGPLVKQSSFGWMVTPVVEYFHLLPYAGILNDFFSREVISNSPESSSVDSGNEISGGYRMTGKHSCTMLTEIDDGFCKDSGIVASNINETDLLKQKNDNGHCTSASSTVFVVPDSGNMDKDTPVIDHANVEVENIDSTMQHVMNCNADKQSTRNEISMMSTDEEANPLGGYDLADHRVKDGSPNKICDTVMANQAEKPVAECMHVTYSATARSTDNSWTVDTNSMLSQSAVRALERKINKLRHRQLAIDEEMTRCDKTIETILAGSNNDLGLKIESIFENFSVVYLGAAEDGSGEPSQSVNRKRLSEAILTMQNSCHELDSICYENNWALPTYLVSRKDGGFEADITLQGMDFEYSIGSGVCASPRESRRSAAVRILAKLRGEKHQKP